MTIHYHGTPITPQSVLNELTGHFFCVSYVRPDNVEWCHQNGQGVMLDNGAFSVWQRGQESNWPGFYAWAEEWLAYPTSWAVIPDVIMGDEQANDELIMQWPHGQRGAPVWHMHESLERLERLCSEWPRVCIGSSAEFRVVGSDGWHRRMCEAMNLICKRGIVPAWLHMLRGMAAARWGYPFASVDSTDIARNHNRPQNTARGMADIWDAIQCSPRWKSVATQSNLFTEAA